jgi:hypothetical protein
MSLCVLYGVRLNEFKRISLLVDDINASNLEACPAKAFAGASNVAAQV